MTGGTSIRSVVAVVLNWCAEADSARAIGSLLAHGGPGVTVLLVDNASPDGSGSRLAARFPTLPYLQTGANLGYAGGNQRAICWALEQGADAILLVNDDAELRPGCLPALRQLLETNPAVGACAPTVVHAPPHDHRVWWGGGVLVAHKASGAHLHAGVATQALPRAAAVPVSALNGCVLLLRSEALRQVGGLCEAFFCYVEDTELSMRLAAGGWALAWVPAAVAVHHLPFPEPPPSPWAITQRDRNRRLLARLHLRGATRLRFLAWYYPTRLAVAARYLLRGDRPRAAAIWRGATAALPHVPYAPAAPMPGRRARR
jgi:GT2 family glycosyltransferase